MYKKNDQFVLLVQKQLISVINLKCTEIRVIILLCFVVNYSILFEMKCITFLVLVVICLNSDGKCSREKAQGNCVVAEFANN